MIGKCIVCGEWGNIEIDHCYYCEKHYLEILKDLANRYGGDYY